jgi:hypothetical protein
VIDIVQALILGMIVLAYLTYRYLQKIEEVKLAQIRASNGSSSVVRSTSAGDITVISGPNDDDDEDEHVRNLRAEISAMRRRRDALMAPFTKEDVSATTLAFLAPQLAEVDDRILKLINELQEVL